MAKDPLYFSIFELIYEERHPALDDLTNIFRGPLVYDMDDRTTCSIQSELIDGYFWMTIEYGASHPRPAHLIDRSQHHKLVENKRTEDQVEPSRQLFCIYNPEEGNIYLSDSRKNSFIEKLFNHFGEQKFLVKRVLVDPEEFLRQLRTVDKMSIAAKSDLISHSGDLMQPVQDIFGYDAPDRFFISADYGVSLCDRLRNRFRLLNKECKEGRIKKFICVGKNEYGLETVFNTDNFTQKIVANVNKLENGLYEKSEVRNEIAEQLKKLRT